MPYALRLNCWGSFLVLASLLVGCQVAGDEPVNAETIARTSDPEMLHAALGRMTGVMIHDIFSPPQASRAYAYASIATYEAARHADPALQSLAGQLNGLDVLPPAPAGSIHPGVAGVTAFLEVAEALVFSHADLEAYHTDVDAQVDALGLPGPLVERSRNYGRAVAEAIRAWAADDGYAATRGGTVFTVTDDPARWRPTPPGYFDGVEPNWALLRPFVMDEASQFKPPPPKPYSLDRDSPFYREVMEVYEIGRTLTDEQRAIASFWDCNPYAMHTHGHAMFATKKITPGGHWMGIAGIAARSRGLDFAHTAEAYARTAIALADGFISAWDEKYRSNLVRPETIINAHIDEAWVPLLQTPPFPEYTSGHSVISNAAAAVLTDLFGENLAFSDTTEIPYGLPARSFSSFQQAADEAAISRLYGGIHYRMAAEVGATQGQQVGALVVSRVQTRALHLATTH